MAVSIDTVYQRVLTILNKEQRGYLTPEEYNLFANQAQMDIFEQYFYDINQFSRMPGNDTEYSDMLDILNEKISLFETTSVLTHTGSYYTIPTDLYRVGTVIYNNAEAEKTNKNEYLYVTSSPITAPGNDFPIYTKDTNGFKVYGSVEITSSSDVSLNYIKKPSKAIWNYTSVLGNAQYTATGSVDFELHPSEETELVTKILGLAGLLLQDMGIYQVASAEENKDIQQQKS